MDRSGLEYLCYVPEMVESDQINGRELYEYAEGFAELDSALLGSGTSRVHEHTVIGSRSIAAWPLYVGAYSDPTYCRMTHDELLERANAWMRLAGGEVVPLLGTEHRSWEEVGPCDPDSYGASMTARAGHRVLVLAKGSRVKGATYRKHGELLRTYRKVRTGTMPDAPFHAIFATVHCEGHGKWSTPKVHKVTSAAQSARSRVQPVPMEDLAAVVTAAEQVAREAAHTMIGKRCAWGVNGTVIRMTANPDKHRYEISVRKGDGKAQATTVRKVEHVGAAIRNRTR